MLRVYGCVFYSIPFFFAYMCMRMTFKSKVYCGCALVEGFVYPGTSRLPNFYAPPVYFPAIIGGLAVWCHNKLICNIHS